MSKRVHLVHGVLSNGSLDIFRLAPFWEAFGYEVVKFEYGVHLAVAFQNDKWSRRLAETVQDGDVICAHSNGCLLAVKASWLSAPISQIVMIAPALPVDFTIGPQVKCVHVWHSPFDEATWFARYVYKSWGPAGSVGYKGDDPRMVNYDRSTYRVPSLFHLDMFRAPALSYFGPLFAGEAEAFAATMESEPVIL